jgi:putative effector of murein hydrolase
MEWYEWAILFLVFGIFFSISFFLFVQRIFAKEGKRVLVASVFIFFLFSLATAFFGIQYAERKIQENMLKNLIEKLEKKKNFNIPKKDKNSIKNISYLL